MGLFGYACAAAGWIPTNDTSKQRTTIASFSDTMPQSRIAVAGRLIMPMIVDGIKALGAMRAISLFDFRDSSQTICD